MAIRNIRTEEDEVLRKRCREITEMTPKLATLIDDMLETMYEANGVGLAAPQVGILKRVVVIDVGDGALPVQGEHGLGRGLHNTLQHVHALKLLSMPAF